MGWATATTAAYSPSTELISVIPVESPESTTIEPFEFKLTQATELDQISSHLLNEIRELHFQQAPRGFPTQRPTTTITDRELIGPITFWGNEVSGEAAFMFIQHEGKSYGLSETSYESLEGLIDAAMNSTWARNSLSREFVKNTFCDWARQRFGVDGLSFPEALSTAAKKSVTAIEVWAPIANMEIEQNFDFGPVRIESVTNSVMESLRSRTLSTRPEQRQQVDQLFDELENEILGYAAVVISMKTEPAIAQERALKIAQDTVGLLRFFSLPASQSHLFSSVALTGAEYIPTSKLIVLRESGFLLQHSALPKHVAHWRLPKQELAELTSGLLNIAASLVLPDGLSEFALVVRNSLLTYSKGTTLVDPLDRLRNSLSALEGILLKHEIEPRAHNIANRMSLLLAPGLADREAIKQIVHQIYWLQGQSPLVDYGRRENELIMIFTTYACNLLRLALGNISTFSSKTQFLIEVDRMSQFNR